VPREEQQQGEVGEPKLEESVASTQADRLDSPSQARAQKSLEGEGPRWVGRSLWHSVEAGEAGPSHQHEVERLSDSPERQRYAVPLGLAGALEHGAAERGERPAQESLRLWCPKTHVRNPCPSFSRTIGALDL